MIVYDARGKPVRLGESVGSGGEATVYRLKDRPDWLAKVYKPGPRPNYARKLNWMVKHPPANPTSTLGHPSIAWPSELVVDARRKLTGYLMPYIQGAVPILEVFNPRRRAETLPGFDRRYLHRTARNLAATLGALHQSGYVVGDLNESNVMVTSSAMVTLIDADSFQAQEQRNGRLVNYPCPVGKLEYTPPELQGQAMEKVLRLPEHDSFGLGVLIFQLLMGGSHPFRAQWMGKGEPPPIEVRIAQGMFPYAASPNGLVRPPKNSPALDSLHPVLVEQVQRCFSDGKRDPSLRPSPAEWEQAIIEAEKALSYCTRGHIYSTHLAACPLCPPKAEPKAYPPKPRPAPTRTPRPAAAKPAPPPPASAAPASQVRNAPPPTVTVGKPSSRPAPSLSQRIWQHFQPISGTYWSRPRPKASPILTQQSNRKKMLKTLVIGGSLGALVGMLPGGLVGLIHGSLGEAAAWSLLWAWGGVAAGLLLGWQPGYRLAQRVSRMIGWDRFWTGIGLLGGAFLGGLLGMMFWWAIFPVFIGLVTGAKLGLSTGRKIWIAGNRYGWERIWAAMGAFGAALLGWMIARWVGASGLGGLTDQAASQIASWLSAHSVSWPLVLLVTGALGGALGGAIAGTFTNLVGRLTGLVD